MADSPDPHPDPADALHNIIDDTPEADDIVQSPPIDPNERLDATRIRNLATLRRTAIRQRSWNLIGAIVCLVAAFEVPRPLARMIAQHLRLPPLSITILTLLGAALGILGFAIFLTKAIRLTRELRRYPPQPEAAEIDFTPLQSGEQFANNLAAMQPLPPETPEKPQEN